MQVIKREKQAFIPKTRIFNVWTMLRIPCFELTWDVMWWQWCWVTFLLDNLDVAWPKGEKIISHMYLLCQLMSRFLSSAFWHFYKNFGISTLNHQVCVRQLWFVLSILCCRRNTFFLAKTSNLITSTGTCSNQKRLNASANQSI